MTADMTTDGQMRHVYETWHRAIVGRDLDKLMAPHAREGVLDSSVVLVPEKAPSGIIRGRDRIRKHFASFFRCSARATARTGIARNKSFWGGKSLVWEYPNKGPDGDQLDVVESMDLKDGVIVYHRMYWGRVGFKALNGPIQLCPWDALR
jgi:ketosteroid isomerase-like protein